jgi:membrane protease YdiL (CAAX protease family)
MHWLVELASLQQEEIGTDLIAALAGWAAAHRALVLDAGLTLFFMDGIVVFVAIIKRRQVGDKLKAHDTVEKVFIVSFFSVVILGVSWITGITGILGLGSSLSVIWSFVFYLGTILSGLGVLLAAVACFATFVVLGIRLFIEMKPLNPVLPGEVNWGGTPVLVVAMAFFVLSTPLAFFSETVSSLAGSFLFIVLPVILVLYPYERTVRALGLENPRMMWVMKTLPLVVVLVAGNELVYRITERIFGQFPLDELVEQMVSRSPALMSLNLAVLGPVGEEIFFRGFAYPALRKKYGVKKGILASALFFGAYHVIPWQIPYAVVAGIILAFVYEKTQSLYPSILFHIINNSVAVLSMWM